MESDPPGLRNPYLREGTVPGVCPSEECGRSLEKENAIDRTTEGIPFRLRCPSCGTLFDQACHECGSKDIQKINGIEECLRCGEILQLGAAPTNSNTH
jgi:rRNA maturation endonuclease Nob1